MGLYTNDYRTFIQALPEKAESISEMSSSETPTPRYQHFILQLRQELSLSAGESPVWRLSLEDPRSSERKGFKNVAELATYLEEWMKQQVVETY